MFYQDPPEPSSDSLPSGEKSKTPRRQSVGICPVCESRFDREISQHLPFCSSRCRQVDLGRWLNESYGLPYENDDRPAPEHGFEDDL